MHDGMFGPQTPIGQDIHAEKYRSPGESFREAMNRVAAALQDDHRHYHELREILLDMRFLPGGRVQTAMGSGKHVTAYNCFVSGTILDSFVHGEGCIMDAAKDAAATMRMGGGIGYDFSTLRPRGAMIKKLQSASSGPLAFMEIFDAICRCVASSGHRRGAQMGVLRVDHPDVMEFVDAKTNENRLTGFNISLAVTDEFMEALATGRPFALRHGDELHREVDPAEVWEKIMRTTWDWAEPGVIYIDTINRLNNLRYCETIAATNPCGEQPLPPHGACLLGSFNLTRYLRQDGGRWVFDWDQLGEDIPPVVRAMDNVIDRTRYPLVQQQIEAKAKRRMGLGVTGLANAAEALGTPYGSAAFVAFEAKVLDRIARDTYRASALLAKEKGAFPAYHERYLEEKGTFFDQFFRHMLADDETVALVAKYGLRNSHLGSIAPTGTISLAADNVSSAIEPVFQHEYERTLIMPDGPRRELVQDYGVRVLGVRGKTSDEVTVDEHLAVLTAAARRVDSAVSKTCNVPAHVEWDDFKSIYHRAWEAGAKGCTTFNTGGKRGGVLVARETRVVEEPEPQCKVDLATGRRECA